MSNNDSISSRLNHLYDNTWALGIIGIIDITFIIPNTLKSSSFARIHLGDCSIFSEILIAVPSTGAFSLIFVAFRGNSTFRSFW